MIDLKALREGLTKEQIIDIVTRLGADRFIERNDYIIFPTICHNFQSAEASMKLYYYFNNQIFYCYTGCDEAFSIFELIDKRFKLCGRHRVDDYESKKSENDYTFYDIVSFIIESGEVSITTRDTEYYRGIGNKFNKREEIILPPYPDNALAIFNKIYPIEWIEEGISEATMDKFNITYSISRNSAIIPHYDINGNLVGIRERNFDEDKIAAFGKYRPIKIENITYKHPTSLTLYGLNFVKDNIKRLKKVIIFEGEKSCMLSYEYFCDNSVAVATCGNHININQVHLLVKNFDLNEIIIAFDKEYTNHDEFLDYSARMRKMCQKYTQYCDFSFIRDKDNLLNYKDAPIDQGKATFIKLLEERVKV